MSTKLYSLVTSVIFGVVAVLHLVRLVGQWGVSVDGWQFPMWVSGVGLVVAGLLSYAGFRVFWQSKKGSRMTT